MFRFLAPLFLSLSLIVGCGNAKIPFSSIQHLGDLHEDNKIHQFCTTWATRLNGVTRWVTAGHCVTATVGDDNPNSLKWMIGDKPAEFERIDTSLDLALFKGPATTGLTVSLTEPEIGSKVRTISFFWPNGVYVEGIVSGGQNGNTIFQLPSGPGASGAPVLDFENTVVGTVMFIDCPRGSCPMTGGNSVKELRSFLYGE